MAIKTRITEFFGIEHPIVQGGMHYVGAQKWPLRSPTPAGWG